MNGQMNLSDLLMRAFGPSATGGRTGALDLNENPEAAGTLPPPQTAGAKDVWDRLGAQLDFANQVATVGRGMYGDLTSARGPAASPLMARPAGAAQRYQPTVQMPMGGGMRLSDLLARR